MIAGCDRAQTADDGAKPGETKPDETKPGETKPGETKPGETKPDGTKRVAAPCDVKPEWFSAPSRADGSKFPGNDTVQNCDFHQWSVQNFLWLTSKQGEGTVFEAFADPASVFVPGGPPTPYPGRGASSSATMLPRWAKNSSSADLVHIFQAGPGAEILVDQSGEVVFYSNHLDQRFWDFININKFWDLAILLGIEQGKASDIDFPVDSFELKSAWRVAEKGGKVLIPDADRRFYVIEATIPVVGVNKVGRVILSGKTVKAKMALIGMHVAGIVAHHPEFIWATFEHVDNAPDCAALGDASTTKPQWSLCAGKATPGVCNQYDPNNPLGPVDVCRAQPHGAGSAENRDNIKRLDTQMRALTKDTVWANYTYVGAIWTTGKVPLNNPVAEDLRGSLVLANTTMETFKQDENCFSCHNSGVHDVTVGAKTVHLNGKNINLSHFVVNYQAVQMAKQSK